MSLLHWRHSTALDWRLLCLSKLVVIVFVPLLSPVFHLVHSGFLKYTSRVHFITVNVNTTSPQPQQKIYESSSHFQSSPVQCFHFIIQHKCVNIFKNQKRKTNGLFMSNYVKLYKHLFIQNSSAGPHMTRP